MRAPLTLKDVRCSALGDCARDPAAHAAHHALRPDAARPHGACAVLRRRRPAEDKAKALWCPTLFPFFLSLSLSCFLFLSLSLSSPCACRLITAVKASAYLLLSEGGHPRLFYDSPLSPLFSSLSCSSFSVLSCDVAVVGVVSHAGALALGQALVVCAPRLCQSLPRSTCASSLPLVTLRRPL